MHRSLARRSLTAFLAVAAASCLTASRIDADQSPDPAAFTAPAGVNDTNVDVASGTAALSFDDLTSIRGRYAPETDSAAVARTAMPDRAAADALRVPAGLLTRTTLDNASAPALFAGGAIQAFDLTMGSTWQTSSGTSYSAGIDLGVNFATNVTSEHTYATVANGTETPVTGGTSTIDFATGGFTGVGQTIAITGNGNTISNHAGITIGSDPLPASTASTMTGTPCASACVVGIDAAGARLSIALPGGVVAQKLGASGIAQTAQITSDANTIANGLLLHLQIAPHPAFSAAQVLPALLQGNLLR